MDELIVSAAAVRLMPHYTTANLAEGIKTAAARGERSVLFHAKGDALEEWYDRLTELGYKMDFVSSNVWSVSW